MKETEYVNLVGENLLKVFDNVYVIDLLNDEVFNYFFENNYAKFKEKSSFISFIDKEKLLVTENYLDNYVSILSGNFDDSASFSYKKNDNYAINDYYMVAKKVNFKNNDLIIVMNGKGKIFSTDIKNEDDGHIINDISDIIIKIYNTVDIDEENAPGYEYIKSLLEDLTKRYNKLGEKVEKNIIKEASKSKNSLLIVDDDIITRNLLKKTFETDFNIVTASNGKEAIELLEDNYKKSTEVLNYVGIFLDIAMPVLDGFAVLEYLKNNGLINAMPVIIISAAEDKETRQRVYSYNIADMLEKPFNLEIIKLRINNFINLYKNSNNLTNLIVNKDKDLNFVIESIKNSYFYDYKDDINVVTKITSVLANKYLEINPGCGLNQALINKVIEAAKYYNIGKTLVPNKILRSKNLLVDQEKLCHDHTVNGSILIKRLLMNTNDHILAEYAYNIALSHHENYDGTGYPKKIAGDNIPIYVQIVSLAALYNKYLHEDGLNHVQIVTNIKALEGKNFSKDLINVFDLVKDEFAIIKEQ